MRRLLTAVVTFALFIVPSIYAQNFGPLPPLTAHVDVNVVNVDVTVTDRHGKPVMDLTRNDFEVFEDGKLVKVTNFSIIEKALVRQTAAPASQASQEPSSSPERVRRRIVLLVDNNYVDNIERNAALRIFEKQLDTVYAGDYDWAVAAIGRVLQVVQPFTNQKPLIHAAIDKVQHMPTFMNQHDMDRSILSDRTRKQLDFQTDSYDYGQTVRFESRENTFQSIASLQNTARAVAEMARAHAADDSKKYMILLTGGIENNTSFTAYDKGTDPYMRALQLEKAKIVDAIVQEANAANFTIHIVNARARGMQAPQHDVENKSSGIDMSSPNFFQRGGGSDPIDVSNVDSIPLSIALGTGGSYLPSTDVGHSFSVIDAQTSNFYSLGYSPAHNGDRQYHHIRVHVKRAGVLVANRVGYYDLTSDDRLEQMLRARMTFDVPTGPLPVQVNMGQPRTFEKKIVLPLTAALPIKKLTMLPREGSYVGRVHVYVSVFNDQGQNVGFSHQLQEVTMSTAEYQAAADPFRYTLNVRLQKGDFTVVVTLRDDLSNELGSSVKEVRL
jgi:VWFA-related protein